MWVMRILAYVAIEKRAKTFISAITLERVVFRETSRGVVDTNIVLIIMMMHGMQNVKFVDRFQVCEHARAGDLR